MCELDLFSPGSKQFLHALFKGAILNALDAYNTACVVAIMLPFS